MFLGFIQLCSYDQLLKTSHAFNILDSRGFVGVTERARYFARMRRYFNALIPQLCIDFNFVNFLLVWRPVNAALS